MMRGGVLPFDAPAAEKRRAIAVTLFLDNQKNAVWAESITMKASEVLFGCAVGGAASPFLHLRRHRADLDTPLCTYYNVLGGAGKSISGSNIVAFLRLWAGKLGHRQLGFHPNEIGSHSLRSGGAMTLH